jgi:2-haloacid dehalogenase
MPELPTLLTFDIFGTVVDWRSGMLKALWHKGIALDDALWEKILLSQESQEAGPYRRYCEIAAQSLEEAARFSPGKAADVASEIGRWPLFPDSPSALRRLLGHFRCAATTNSDRSHRAGVEEQLGVKMSAWICAEDLRLYKPSERFWQMASERLEEPLSERWWHISAYTDYDLEPARRLGLTTVFVKRPHARPGPCDHQVVDLEELATSLGA